MGAKFKETDRDQLFLLPHNLKDWIPDDDIVHFIIEAAAMVPLGDFTINHNGTGSAQYHPHMMLALLLYCYSHGFFSSRRIERATYKDVAVRYLCGNTHPDHDTICTFRVRNEKAIASAFLYILKLAKEMNVLKIGTVSIDGTHIKANASIYKSVRYDRATALEKELELEIDKLLEQAKNADSSNNDDDDDHLDGDLKRLSTLRDKMKEARERLEKQAKDQYQKDLKDYQRKMEERKKRNGRGRPPKKPQEKVEDSSQTNLTDSDSRIMKKSKRSSCTQSYNAQAAVDADGSMLILGGYVTNHGNDKKELDVAVESVSDDVGEIDTVLADAGYASEEPVKKVQKKEIEVLVSLNGENRQDSRTYDWAPKQKNKKQQKIQKEWMKEMAASMQEEQNKAKYKLRKQTVEPVFGIIKETMGFRQFLLRGLKKVNLEWTLVAAAFNLKMLAKYAK